MVKMSVHYKGQKHAVLSHGPSGTRIETDAPVDNGGRGQKFSPTDLLTVSLGSCILTTLDIVAEREGWPFRFDGSSAEVGKEMSSNPRRVGTIHIHLKLPASIPTTFHQKINTIADNCPVALSLHPDTKVKLTKEYCL